MTETKKTNGAAARTPAAVIAATPANEERRVASVKRSGLMDSENLSRFDIYTRLFRHIAGVPIAYTGLLDEARQYFLSENFTGCLFGAKEVARNDTLCQHALLSTKPIIVNDMRQHPTFENHPLIVGDPYWVFWAGFPLVTSEGYVLGTLCAVDFEPRELTAEQIDLLSGVAADMTMSIQLQTDQQELIADKAQEVMTALKKNGMVSVDEALAFLKICSGKSISSSEAALLDALGLIEKTDAGLDLTPKGRTIKTDNGLGPSSYKVAASPLKDTELLGAMLDDLDL